MASVNEKTHKSPTNIGVLPRNLPAGARLRVLKSVSGLPAGAILRMLPVKPGNTRKKPDAIGTIEPRTDRLVLQQPKDAEKIQELATDEHETVKSGLELALAGIAGAKIYAARDEKDPERVAEKVEEGQSPRTMRDYSGFRVAVESPEAWKQAAAALRAHFEVPDEQDEFEKGSALHFHGHTVQVRVSGSKVTHEVQILPREVAENVDGDHELYEKAREGDKDAERRLMDRNRAHWVDFLDRNGQAKYKFGSTQADIEPGSEAGRALEAARTKIADVDLAGDGRDIGGNHVTVRYGVRDVSDPEKLRAFLRAQVPFEVTLGATDAFPVSEHSEGAAPIIAPVESPELRRIHEEIAAHGDFKPSDFAEYRPHATVAYVRPGAVKKYTGMRETKGKRFRVDTISLSFRDGTQDPVQLAGDSASSDTRSAPKGAKVIQLATAREGGRGETVPIKRGPESPEPLSGAATQPEKTAPAGVFGEKLQAALKRSSAPTVPTGPGGIPIRVSQAMLQPVTGTPEEAEQLAFIAPDLATRVADYLARNTKDGTTTIATDAAKNLIPAFGVDPLTNDRDVAGAAAAIRDGALNTLLQSPPDAARPYVLIVVGSPGSGKTTSLALGGERPGVGIKIEAIPDDAAKFSTLLRKILASGRKPIVEWVWAGTAKATANRMMLRAVGDGQRPGIGRVVETGYMAKAWTALPKVLDEVRKEFGPRVVWLVADNSGPPGTAKVTSDIGTWLRRGERMQEENARAQMDAELDALDRRGRLKGEQGQAALAAARASRPGLPREEILDVPDKPEDLRSKMRMLAERGSDGPAKVRSGEETAWQRAGKVLREDPTAQVPF